MILGLTTNSFAQLGYADVQVANFTPHTGLKAKVKLGSITAAEVPFQGEPPVAYTIIKGQVPSGLNLTLELLNGQDQKLTEISANLTKDAGYLLAVIGGFGDVPVTAQLVKDVRFTAENEDQIDFFFLNASVGTGAYDIKLVDNDSDEIIEDISGNFEYGDTSDYYSLGELSLVTFLVKEAGGEEQRIRFDMSAARGKSVFFAFVGSKDGQNEEKTRLLAFTSDADPSAGNRIAPLVPTSITDTPPAVADQFILFGNYPNPFNPTTVLRFQLPGSGQVSIEVFDLLGRQRNRMNLGLMGTGIHHVPLNASGWASGVYLYRVNWEGKSLMGKMTMIK